MVPKRVNEWRGSSTRLSTSAAQLRKKTWRQWRAVSDTVSNLNGAGFEPSSSRTDSDIELTGFLVYFCKLPKGLINCIKPWLKIDGKLQNFEVRNYFVFSIETLPFQQENWPFCQEKMVYFYLKVRNCVRFWNLAYNFAWVFKVMLA